MTNIYAANINQPVDERQIEKFLGMISKEKKRQIERFRFREDYLRSLYGDIIVRTKIEKITGTDCGALRFDKNEYGKPYVCDIPDLHFNISHSGDWVVCVLSNYKCGIDVQMISENRHIHIAERFFAASEYTALMEKKGKEQIEYFFDIWTLKESYIKWKGEGLHIPLTSFAYEKRGDSFYLSYPDTEHVRFLQYRIADGYKLSVCVEEDVNELSHMNMMLL